MKIKILLDAKPINKTPLKVAHKYKDIAKNEIDNMLKAGIIYLVDQSEWACPMVVQPKKHNPKRLRSCVDHIWINIVTLIDPFPSPFCDEIINEVAGDECYYFIDGFSRYNEMPIAKEYQHKATFFCEFGSFFPIDL